MVELNDIEMKEVDPSNASTTTNVTAPVKDANTLTLDGKQREGKYPFDFFLFRIDIKEQVRTIEKAVNSKEPRYILRVLRALATTRKRLNEDVIRRLILFYYGVNSSERELLLGFALAATSQVRSTLIFSRNSRSITGCGYGKAKYTST